MSMSGVPRLKETPSLVCGIHHVKMVLKETLGLSQPYNNSGKYNNIYVCPECIWDVKNIMVKIRNWQQHRDGSYVGNNKR